MKNRIYLLAVLILCLLLVEGCGYTTRASLRGDLRTIYVEHFKNDIDFSTGQGDNLYLPLLEVKVRDAIISRFQFDGNLKIAEGDDADLVLTGALKSYSRDALRYDDNDDVEEYRVRITVSLQMYDEKLGEVAWTENRFSGEGDYFLSGSQAKSEDAAVDAAIEDLARRVVERTVESW